MARHASRTSPKSPTSVLNGLVKKGQTDAALTLLANLRAQHLLTTVAVNVVIATGRCYSWSLAVALLQDLRSCSLCLTVVSLNSLLSSMHRFSAWRQAASTFALERTVAPDRITHNVLIKTCAEKQRWEAAQAIVMAMRQGAVQPDQYTCSSLLHNVLIKTCAEKQRWEAAQAIVMAMRQGAVQPDQYTCSSLLSCSWPAAQVLLDHVDLDMACFRASIGRGTWERSLAVVSRMWTLGLRTDGRAFNALFTCLSGWRWAIRGLERHTRWLMSQMSRQSLQQSVVTCGAAINACEPSGFWQLAVWLLSLAVFDEVCYGAAISVCEKAQRWRTAFQLLHGVRSQRLRLDAVSVSAAISACETGEDADIDIWRAPLFLLFRMAAWNIMPNQISYSSAAAACRAHRTDSWPTTLQIMDDMASSWRLDITSCNLVLGICESQDLVHRIPELLAEVAREFFAERACRKCSQAV
eukprot:s2154_g9.t1